MGLDAALRTADRGLPIVPSPELANSVHWTPSQRIPVHRWFRYREGYSPHLFAYFPDSRTRLDPFCGCGTTLLESAKQGVRSFGVDLNPLATFVARVKTRTYTRGDSLAFSALAERATVESRDIPPCEPPAYPLISKLFLPESLDTLLRIKAYIQTVDNPKLRNVARLAWLAILERCANVFKEGNGLKYRNKRRRPGQYVTVPDEEWIPKYFGKSIPSFVIHQWRAKCTEISQDMLAVHLVPGTTPRIRTGSCLDNATLDFGAPVDLVIFSPPYANRFDYFEAFKIELWMGDFVTQPRDMQALRLLSVRNNLAADRSSLSADWPALDPFLDEMDPEASSVHMGIKAALRGYFTDMRLLMCHLRTSISSGGQVVIVVGNSAYAKSIIPTDALIARIAQEEGYSVEGVNVARHLHVSSQQRSHLTALAEFMRESVIVLRIP